MRSVTAASPAISVKLSSPYSQNCVLPPKPRSLIIESRKSRPYFSARSAISLLRSKLGMYCGEFSEISQPLLLMGTKTPTCMCLAPQKIEHETVEGIGISHVAGVAAPFHFGKRRQWQLSRKGPRPAWRHEHVVQRRDRQDRAGDVVPELECPGGRNPFLDIRDRREMGDLLLGFGVEQGEIPGNPVGRIEKDRLGADIGRGAAFVEQFKPDL